MFHKAVELRYLEGTALEVVFQDGIVKRYDMSSLFEKYPQLQALKDRDLFLSGELMGAYGIRWNDDLDIETETVASARALSGMSQKQLAVATGIDQSDISKIERGVANPSVSTLERIAKALGGQLTIHIAIPVSK